MSTIRGKDSAESHVRPRVEGEREQEILDAALDVLAEVGYDRLTMDAVAAHAKASKATLYRRWNSKATLIIGALISQKEPSTQPDTGSLRGDLLATYCRAGGMTDTHQMAVIGSLVTAVTRDSEFAEAFRRDFIGPKVSDNDTIFARARERGEIRSDVDLELIAQCLPGIIMHRLIFLGEQPTEELITQIIDHVILPAATRG